MLLRTLFQMPSTNFCRVECRQKSLWYYAQNLSTGARLIRIQRVAVSNNKIGQHRHQRVKMVRSLGHIYQKFEHQQHNHCPDFIKLFKRDILVFNHRLT